jgi:hypothetical protein
VAWLLEQWLLLSFCALLLWPQPLPFATTLVDRVMLLLILLCVAVPLLSLLLHTALAGSLQIAGTNLHAPCQTHYWMHASVAPLPSAEGGNADVYPMQLSCYRAVRGQSKPTRV